MPKRKPSGILSIEQCRAGRALLAWSQEDLAEKAETTQRTVADFERGARQPYSATLSQLRTAMEMAGVRFLSQGESASGGQGVRFILDDR